MMCDFGTALGATQIQVDSYGCTTLGTFDAKSTRYGQTWLSSGSVTRITGFEIVGVSAHWHPALGDACGGTCSLMSN